MEVVLDTNFIISCIKKKIDFISELENQGFKILLPKEVMQELKDLKKDLGHESRVAIDLAFQLFDKKDVKRTTIGNRSVDSGLIELGKQGKYIATLDAAIKRMVPNSISINNSSNSLLIQRL